MCRQLAEIIDVVYQPFQWQFAMQLFHLEAPLLQLFVGLPIYHVLTYHFEVGPLHQEDGHTATQSVVDVAERELLVQADVCTRCYAVPVDGQDVVD